MTEHLLPCPRCGNTEIVTGWHVVSCKQCGLSTETPEEWTGNRPRTTPATIAVTAERLRQIDKEGWSQEHDDHHDDGVLTQAAVAYAGLAVWSFIDPDADMSQAPPPRLWPWSSDWWKPSDDPIKNLVRAGALIVAEIDRLKRAEALVNAEWADSTGLNEAIEGVGP